jgi:invasion protein IalB
MSRLRPFLVALLLASTLGTDGEVIAKQRLGSLGSERTGVLLPASPTLAQSATTALVVQLPNGASSISEIYGNWAADCRLVEKQKQCRLLQIQNNSQTNQRVFEVELQMAGDRKLEGTILMPFGLKLDSGVVLRLDDKDLGRGLRFLTCVPVGCLLLVSFPTIAIDAMKKGKMLTVASLNLSDEIITFNVSLDGFAEALARIVELSRWKPSNSSMIQEP